MQKSLRKTKKTNYKNNKTFNKRPNHLKVITIGLIHANWCGHCQALKPEWQKMKNEMKMENKRGKNFHFVEIEDSDSMKEKKINNINKKLKEGKIMVDGFPTIFKIEGGNVKYYQGQREARSLKSWFTTTGNQQENKQHNQQQGFMQQMFGGGCGCSSLKEI
jgi:thiol-disulfide isomerase/thioredoxin